MFKKLFFLLLTIISPLFANQTPAKAFFEQQIKAYEQRKKVLENIIEKAKTQKKEDQSPKFLDNIKTFISDISAKISENKQKISDLTAKKIEPNKTDQLIKKAQLDAQIFWLKQQLNDAENSESFFSNQKSKATSEEQVKFDKFINKWSAQKSKLQERLNALQNQLSNLSTKNS